MILAFLLTSALAFEPIGPEAPAPVLSDADRLELIQNSYQLQACRKREVKHKENLSSCDSDLTNARVVARGLSNEVLEVASRANIVDAAITAERDALASRLAKSERAKRRLNVALGVIGGVGLGYALAHGEP